jgi:hypothetical protein
MVHMLWYRTYRHLSYRMAGSVQYRSYVLYDCRDDCGHCTEDIWSGRVDTKKENGPKQQS